MDWVILIAPGDYDEDVAVIWPVRLALIGLGAFRLGRYTSLGTKHPKQTNIVADDGGTRNLVCTYNNAAAVGKGAAPQLVIGTIGGTDVYRHGKPIANRISGSIIVEGSGWTQANVPAGGTAFLAIADTQVDAGITKGQPTPTRPALDTTGSIPGFDSFSGILVDRHFNSRFRGQILGPLNPVSGTPPAYLLATSFMSQYEGLVQASRYGSVDQAAFGAGLTVSQSPQPFTFGVPPGIANSTIAGTFTGPARSLLLDSTTNTWFTRNGGGVASAGAKACLGGASQTLLVAAGTTLTVGDCGVTLLANASAGSFSVRLPPAVDDLTFMIKNIGSTNSISVVPAIGETIDGASSVTLVPPGTQPGASGIKIVAQGARWWIVGHVQ
jgi:hypothetical protein